MPEFSLHDERITYAARSRGTAEGNRGPRRAHGIVAEDRAVFLKELLEGVKQGRTSDQEITYSARGNIQGAQFFAVAGAVYEACKERGLGRELPTEWFLQDIRD